MYILIYSGDRPQIILEKNFFPSNYKVILKLGENLSYTQTNTEIWKEATISWQTIQVSLRKKNSSVRWEEKEKL